MGLIIDIAIIAIVVLSVFLGYRKGLVALSIQLFAFIIAVVITFILYQPITNFIVNATGIDETIQNSILEKANDIMQEDSEMSNTIVEEVKNNMLPETARTISINIITFVVVIVLFLLVKIGLRFVTAMANLVAKLPILKQANELGGIIYGFIRGLLIIYVILLVVNISGEISPENSVYMSVNETNLGKFMMEYNVLNVFMDEINI